MMLRRILAWMIGSSWLGCSMAANVDTSDDRIALSADGSTLSHTDGGYGGSAAWLHNFNSDVLLGVGGEHQKLSVADWTFGTLTGSYVFGPANQRYAAYGEIHEGAGKDGARHFDYEIEALGLSGSFFQRLTATLEDKRIDVESTHGNLPKVALAYLWNPHLQTTVSYSYSVSGNLGTRLPAVRLDIYGGSFNYIAGGAYGPASAIVLGYSISELVRVKEGYVGIAKPLPRLRSDLSFTADYQDLSGSKRVTLTLNYIVHVGHRTTP